MTELMIEDFESAKQALKELADISSPSFLESNKYRLKPDNSEEIDRIKQEIKTHGDAIDELQAKLKELESWSTTANTTSSPSL